MIWLALDRASLVTENGTPEAGNSAKSAKYSAWIWYMECRWLFVASSEPRLYVSRPWWYQSSLPFWWDHPPKMLLKIMCVDSCSIVPARSPGPCSLNPGHQISMRLSNMSPGYEHAMLSPKHDIKSPPVLGSYSNP